MESKQKSFFERVRDIFTFPSRLYNRWKNYQIKLVDKAYQDQPQVPLSTTDQMQRRIQNGENLQTITIPEKDLPTIEKALGENGVLFSSAAHTEQGMKALVFFEEDAPKIAGVLDEIRTDDLIRAAAKISLKQHEVASKEQAKDVVKKVMAQAAAQDALKRDSEAIAKDPLNLRHVKNQTPELCLCAVHRNGNALEFVKNQTPQICMFAVQERGSALQFVKEQAPELCREAVRRDPNAIRFVKDQTEDLCMSAVKKDPFSLKYIKNPSLSVCKEAVRNNVHAAHLVPEQLKGQFTGALAKSNEIRQAQKMPSFAKGPSFGRGR